MKKLSLIILICFPILHFAQVSGESYQFIASDKNGLVIPHTSDVNMTSDFTIELWIKPNMVTGEKMCLLQKGWCGDSDFIWSVVINEDATVSFTCNDYGNCNYSSSYRVETKLVDGECMHLAFVYTMTTIDVYYNGEPQSGSWVMRSHPGKLQSSNDPINVGMYRDWYSNYVLYYDGFMDDLRIWEVAKTQQEIKDNYLTELNGDENGLVLYHKYDNAPSGDGSTVQNDASLTSNSLDAEVVSLSQSSPFAQLQSCMMTVEEVSSGPAAAQIKVYPNPAVDKVTFEVPNELNELLQFQLFDLSGRLILERSVDGFPFHLSIEGIEKGTYIYHFNDINGFTLYSGQLIFE